MTTVNTRIVFNAPADLVEAFRTILDDNCLTYPAVFVPVMREAVAQGLTIRTLKNKQLAKSTDPRELLWEKYLRVGRTNVVGFKPNRALFDTWDDETANAVIDNINPAHEQESAEYAGFVLMCKQSGVPVLPQSAFDTMSGAARVEYLS